MDNIVSDYNLYKDDRRFLSDLENFSFLSGIGKIGNLGFKEDRDNLNFIIEKLRQIPSIEKKEILYNEIFINFFYRIFWELISELGIATQNFYDFIDEIVYEMNRITIKDYVVIDCHSTDKYNCGRAMMILEGKELQEGTRFLIYNTDDKGFMDINTQILYLGCKNPMESSWIPSDNLVNLGTYSGRIKKEISMLKEDFDVKTFQNNSEIKLVLTKSSPKILITFILPKGYPFDAPSGTFNDLTISEVDIDWSSQNNLKKIVNKLIYKYNNKLFPKHREILCYLLDM